MRKYIPMALLWTLLLAIPFTALALGIAAYLTENMVELANWIDRLIRAPTFFGRPWPAQLTTRLPELVGMVVGQIVILVLLVVARKEKAKEEQHSPR